jgi:hypothetical protein
MLIGSDKAFLLKSGTQLRTQRRDASVEVRLDGARGNTERGGHVRLAQVGEIAQGDGLPLPAGQSTQRGDQGKANSYDVSAVGLDSERRWVCAPATAPGGVDGKVERHP